MTIGLIASVVSASGLGLSGLEATSSDVIAVSDDGWADSVASTPAASHRANDYTLMRRDADAPRALQGLRPAAATLFSVSFAVPLTTASAPDGERKPLIGLGMRSAQDSDSGMRFNLQVQDSAQRHSQFDRLEPLRASPAVQDQRRANPPAPALYVFASAADQAMSWGFMGRRETRGAVLRDQLTTGDMQLGVGCAGPFGGRAAIGWVGQKIKYNDPTGDHDVRVRQNFAAFSYSVTL